jgi:hypothetical protein
MTPRDSTRDACSAGERRAVAARIQPEVRSWDSYSAMPWQALRTLAPLQPRGGILKPPQSHEDAKDPSSPQPGDSLGESFCSFPSFDKVGQTISQARIPRRNSGIEARRFAKPGRASLNRSPDFGTQVDSHCGQEVL